MRRRRVPVGDPQFWVATAIFGYAVWWLLRGPLAGVAGKRRPRGKGVKLTVKGRPVK